MKTLALLAVFTTLAGCAVSQAAPPAASAADVPFLNRATWGATSADARELAAMGRAAWLERQLNPPPGDDLPPEAAAQVTAMRISREPVIAIAQDIVARRQALRQADDKSGERKALQQDLAELGREAQARFLLRALYSPWQLREQMTWFWMNHFNVFMGKGELRGLVGDYEESAIRPHALGRFRDLLGAVARHPAMLRYLDNAQNAARKLNENYARELMELHTLGVDGGYTQGDVQELARVLTGFTVLYRRDARERRPAPGAVREGLFAFTPVRHDFGDKVLLGAPIRARGAAELDEALDRLARHPSTARFVSRKLALFFAGDEPPPALVDRLAAEFRRTDGDIAALLRVLFASPEFSASLDGKLKDPLHYALSALRLAYDGKEIRNPAPIVGWLARMGEPLYARQTPDGYPLAGREWASPGQMEARFEVAKAIGYSSPPLHDNLLEGRLGATTRATLAKAENPKEWNFLFLSSPEFMRR